MTRSLTATTDVRFRPAVVATLITLTFLTGIGAGLGLARVTAGPMADQAAIAARGGSDSATEMSSAAYGAAHQAAIAARVGSGSDMSAAAYAAAQQAAIDARSGSDMSAAAYDAAHRAALDAQAQ